MSGPLFKRKSGLLRKNPLRSRLSWLKKDHSHTWRLLFQSYKKWSAKPPFFGCRMKQQHMEEREQCPCFVHAGIKRPLSSPISRDMLSFDGKEGEAEALITARRATFLLVSDWSHTPLIPESKRSKQPLYPRRTKRWDDRINSQCLSYDSGSTKESKQR